MLGHGILRGCVRLLVGPSQCHLVVSWWQRRKGHLPLDRQDACLCLARCMFQSFWFLSSFLWMRPLSQLAQLYWPLPLQELVFLVGVLLYCHTEVGLVRSHQRPSWAEYTKAYKNVKADSQPVAGLGYSEPLPQRAQALEVRVMKEWPWSFVAHSYICSMCLCTCTLLCSCSVVGV